MRAIFLLTLLFFLPHCTKKTYYTLRFQNLVGLELSSAGCSIANFGGADRMCEYGQSHPADLTFQVGPGLYKEFLSYETPSPTELLQKRHLLWEEWKREKVRFYSVADEDLVPSLAMFEASTDSSITKISTNLKNGATKKFLFEPFFSKQIQGTPLVFLSLTEKHVPASQDWFVEEPTKAFSQVLALLPKDATHYLIIGGLTKDTRAKLARLSQKPLLFVGAPHSEEHTRFIAKEASGAHFVKAADMGRGFGELTVTLEPPKDDKSDKSLQLGKTYYRYKSFILGAMPITHRDCQALASASREQGECSLKTIGKAGCK